MENNVVTLPNFKRDLEPILEMLEQAEKKLSKEAWLALVDVTIERINSVPEQYLSGGVKPSILVQKAVQFIFQERLN